MVTVKCQNGVPDGHRHLASGWKNQNLGSKNSTAVVRMALPASDDGFRKDCLIRRNEEMSRRLCFLCVIFSLLGACGGGDQTPKTGETSAPAASNNNASFNKDDYPVFPNADAGADPAVSAEQGGKGFTGQGWETNTSFELPGAPRAGKHRATRA